MEKGEHSFRNSFDSLQSANTLKWPTPAVVVCRVVSQSGRFAASLPARLTALPEDVTMAAVVLAASHMRVGVYLLPMA